MKIFEFEIQELLAQIIEVEAKNEDEAYQKVKDMYEKEDIVLDSSDFVTFNIKKIPMNDNDNDIKKDNLIAEIVDYLYQDEKKHYEEFDGKKPPNHIFLKLEEIKKLI